MPYAVIRTDKMSGTTNPTDLVSVKFATDIENGNVVLVGGLATGEREVYSATAPAANSPLASVAIVASEEVVKNKAHYMLSDFINEANVPARAYRLASHDIFSVTAEALDGTCAKGSIIELQASTKLKAVATLTTGSTKVGTCIAVEGEWFVIEVA